MSFETFFRLISYAAVFCGFLALWVSGSFGLAATGLFIGVMVLAWFLEYSRRQISEKIGTALILLALPAFFLAWKFGVISLNGDESAIAGLLARLILALSAIKLLQHKTSRDWVFLYLMSFFEVMLAAGLSISPLYLVSFLIYLVIMVCAIVTFQIRKTAAAIEHTSGGRAATNASVSLPVSRLPAAAIILIAFIALIALPMFFTLPRVGGAGFGGNKNGWTASAGFSDTVMLGAVGKIQQNDSVVMRVKLENETVGSGLYFRGVVLDTFDNKAWIRSKAGILDPLERGENDRIHIENARSRDDLSIQTIYLEPLDTPVLFTLPRAVIVQGSFPVLYKDVYGAISFAPRAERISYKVLSDRSLPPPSRLRADVTPYTADERNFRQLPPVYDVRIADLAEQVTAEASNRYDKAKAVESYLRNSFGYTLEQKAKGREPLADFLFNIREGHCEYFATAMAVMLRTQGIATRIVNGFHGGEYNDAAGVTIVRQRNAHAWVEVYFPGEDAWVPFDPTPAAGLNSVGAGSGIAATFRKYIEALETFWIQYFVAFDNQEQRSLVISVRGMLADFQVSAAAYIEYASDLARAWWAEVRGDEGLGARLYALARLAGVIGGIVLGFFIVRKLFRWAAELTLWKRLRRKISGTHTPAIVEFYERMLALLAEKGMLREPHQTPLEFAASLKKPEAIMITDKYNRVRFGGKDLTPDEAAQIDKWLHRLAESP